GKLGGAVLGDDGEEFLAVARRLHRPQTWQRKQFLLVARHGRGHRGERGVVEDHVGGDVGRLGRGGSPRLERREHRGVVLLFLARTLGQLRAGGGDAVAL